MTGCSGERTDICDQYCPTCPERAEFLRKKLLDVAGLSELFKVLGDETRTRIIYLLSINELCVCDLSDLLEMSLPAVSHHLRLLKTMRLVRYRRDGKQVFYRLDDEHVEQLIKVARDHFAEER
ncbi:ArsR/SmtB family transcription factor [Sediminispirochaeta bajacaliforniensis]|uniref:ArsR/SmtB family transcription factor n=1 Tax=Sediminispirochaeta bajacaliforniensis TaxID=148 RepID=UPI000377E70A|nr:metalloregulator ArsR/SmtB family transcription factor [Sediminispirochaeta bajacaliforniensis]